MLGCFGGWAASAFAQEQPEESPDTPPEVYIAEGVRSFQKKNFKKADDMFSRALMKIPNSVEVYYNRATVRYFLNDEAGMLADLQSASTICASCLKAAIALSGQNDLIQLTFAELHGFANYFIGDFKRADTLLRQAHVLGSIKTSIYLYHGLTKARLGRTAEACADFEFAAMRGEPLLFTNDLAIGALRDTVNALCGNPIRDDERFTKRFSQYDSAAFAQNLVYLAPSFPKPRQFCARTPLPSTNNSTSNPTSNLTNNPTSTNQGTNLVLDGSIAMPLRYDSVVIEIRKNGILSERTAKPLTYTTITQGGVSTTFASFSFQPFLRAELSEYQVRLSLRSGSQSGSQSGGDRLLAMSDSVVCGDVYMIGGQSNTVGTNIITPSTPTELKKLFSSPKREFVRTYVQHLSGAGWALAEETHRHFEFPTKRGTLHNRLGTIGATLGQEIVERYGIPVCVIQATAENVETLAQSLPIADALSKERSANNAFQQTRLRLLEAGVMRAVRGFIWYQGELDSAQNYDFRFTGLYDAWRKELTGLGKGYIIQARPTYCGGKITSSQAELREIQRSFGRVFRATEVLAASAPLGASNGCVQDETSYQQLGKQLASLIGRDFYGSTDTAGVSSPLIQKAYRRTGQESGKGGKQSQTEELVLEFTSNKAPASLAATSDVSFMLNKKQFTQSIADAFFITTSRASTSKGVSKSTSKSASKEGDLDESSTQNTSDQFRVFKSLRIEGNTVILQLRKPLPASTLLHSVSYLPAQFYAGISLVYGGPWLVTERGVGALSFYRFPVQAAP